MKKKLHQRFNDFVKNHHGFSGESEEILQEVSDVLNAWPHGQYPRWVPFTEKCPGEGWRVMLYCPTNKVYMQVKWQAIMGEPALFAYWTHWIGIPKPDLK